MQVGPGGVGDVVERIGGGYAGGHARAVDIVFGPPGEVDVMRIDLKKSVLHVGVVKQDGPLGIREVGKIAQTLEVPVVDFTLLS